MRMKYFWFLSVLIGLSTSCQACGGQFYTKTGVLTSPNYPGSYPSNTVCEWIIEGSVGNAVTLDVRNFKLESYNCRYDYLEIRDGANSTSPILGKYCGANIPGRITSFGNQIYLKFHSDYSISFPGFEIEWNSTTIGCNSTTTHDHGSIYSPNYPTAYNDNSECKWKIQVSPGNVILLTILDISLESLDDECDLDFVEIYDGDGTSANRLGRYCNSHHPPQIRTTSNVAIVRFHSDHSVSDRGFQINYQTRAPRPWEKTTQRYRPTTEPTTSEPSWDATTEWPQSRETTWEPSWERTWDRTTHRPQQETTTSEPSWDATTEWSQSRETTWEPSWERTWDTTTRSPQPETTTSEPSWDATTEWPQSRETTWEPSWERTWDTTTRSPQPETTTSEPSWDATTEWPQSRETTWKPSWERTWDRTTHRPQPGKSGNVTARPRVVHANVNTSAILSCHVQGHPLSNFTWRHRGRILDGEDSGYFTTVLPLNETYVIMILHVSFISLEDGGFFSCSAEYPKGLLSDLLYLDVIDVPDSSVSSLDSSASATSHIGTPSEVYHPGVRPYNQVASESIP